MRTLTKDHKIPRRHGGPDTLDNLVSACRSCNQRKGTKTYSEFIERMRAERGEVPLWVEEDLHLDNE
jgi:5-methylcytosine-specific restriction endonuclease McrA